MRSGRVLAFCCSIIAFLLLAGSASASQISEHRVDIDVERDAVHFDVFINFAELNTEQVNYLVFGRVDTAQAKDVLGELECSVEKESYGAQISCTPNSKMRDNYSVEISFDAYGLVRKSGDAELFSYTYGIKDPTARFDVKILLPEGASLLSAEDFDPYFPAGAVIGTELGRRVSLEWSIVKPELGRTYTFDSYFEFFGGSDVFSNLEAYAWYLFFIALVVLSAVAGYYVLRRVRKGAPGGRKLERVFSVLKDDERRVIDVILEKGEKCRQRDIVRATDFSKAKVSRIMLELEERGIIKRERIGRTNKIVLLENVERKPASSE